MIQRLQSLYLFIAGLCYFLYWFFGLEWYEKGYPIIIDFFNNAKGIDVILEIISFDLLSSPAIGTVTGPPAVSG